MNIKKPIFLLAAIIALAPCLTSAQQLPGTTPVTTGGPAVVPTLVTANPGTFLTQSSISGAYFGNGLLTDFTMQEALYRNSSGAVDFYFQVASQFNGQLGTNSILQALAANFGAYATSVGFRPDGAALVGAAGFTLGTIVPITAQRGPDAFGNNSVMFNFAPGLLGGLVSDVLIVSTNASSFSTIGDLGVTSIGAFQSTTTSSISLFSPSGPIVAAPVAAPDSGTTALLLAIGLIALFGAEYLVRARTAGSR